MNKAKIERRCSTCQFWNAENILNIAVDLDYAVCCRYPPTPVASTFKVQDTPYNCVYPVSGSVQSFWSVTKSTDWCGEHKNVYKD